MPYWMLQENQPFTVFTKPSTFPSIQVDILSQNVNTCEIIQDKKYEKDFIRLDFKHQSTVCQPHQMWF